MKTLTWSELDDNARDAALARPAARADAALREGVRTIIEDVRDSGWDALCAHAERIDGTPPKRIAVALAAEDARRRLTTEQMRAMQLARANIARFHDAARPADLSIETLPGLTVRKLWRPIDSVGIYVPGGTAPLFSTLMMLAIPAKAAGVPNIAVVTPPRPDGTLDPAIAVAAELAGIDAIWSVGGAQAIAALAFGAGDIPRCAKICGPGNAWVAEAKTQVAAMAGGPAIDLPAGPSELMVIADGDASPEIVAADLLGQAEHDASAQVVLVTTDATLAKRVAALLPELAASLPRRDIALASLDNARIIIADSLAIAADIANLYAPEHLSLAISDPDALLPAIRNAGAVFAGALAAETFGDYLAGSSHVLPTDGGARAWGGVTVHTFLKAMTVQSVTPAALRKIAAPAATLARIEGLEAHARAAEARLVTQNAGATA
ncbi:histidinol dehydrogenase [Sphingorhabdus soli]|uniref:Histidinol dehydrogenase n=1 Tax=Flavisphingopyxis soli TaxID=2601267 RepID=A0A5C6U7G8_9SPHN|nr:histidinol dehydrogenase [Sphingorhabdus soli]TXC68789.1 histidinol dehydrogenase [Sphingorhabdus soli]